MYLFCTQTFLDADIRIIVMRSVLITNEMMISCETPKL